MSPSRSSQTETDGKPGLADVVGYVTASTALGMTTGGVRTIFRRSRNTSPVSV